MDVITTETIIAGLVLWTFITFIAMPPIVAMDSTFDYKEACFVSLAIQFAVAIIISIVLAINWAIGVLI